MTAVVPTLARQRAADVRARLDVTVARRRVLLADGMTARELDAHCAAGRWQRFGQAVVLHAGPITDRERASVALANVGSRGALTSFTGLAEGGLRGWARPAFHVLVPVGARVTRPAGLTIVAHQIRCFDVPTAADGRRHALAEAAALAADSFDTLRPAAGLCAAVVQQRLVTAADLRAVIDRRSRHRHRTPLLAVLDDVAAGAQSLAEVDFAVLCRRAGLPEPSRQALRTDSAGRRRWLDAEWELPDGRRVVAEVDGGLHTEALQWWDDQDRQNEVSLRPGTTVLRFPSFAVRSADRVVVDQLRRALGPT